MICESVKFLLFPPLLIDRPPSEIFQMALPAGYALDSASGFIYETTTGKGYGPYKYFGTGSPTLMAGLPVSGVTESDLAKGAKGLWYHKIDGSGPYAVDATTIGLLNAG